MTLTPILEGADVDARLSFPPFFFSIHSRNFRGPFSFVASMLFTSGCVGVAGKPGTSRWQHPLHRSQPIQLLISVRLPWVRAPSQTLQIINSGTKSLSVSGISVAGTGFAVKSPALPLVLAAGQSGNVATTFTATATGSCFRQNNDQQQRAGFSDDRRFVRDRRW